MKKMKKILCFLLAFVLTFGCMSGTAFAIEWETKPADGTTWDQPFASGTGGSSNFRIPCLVSLDDGTIVAACDARWNHSHDACGLDTIVSYSKDNGETWNYTFANYLGDNGNGKNQGSSSFIDPAIATDGETVYMIADLYPAGIAINSAAHIAVHGHTGYDQYGNLALTNDSSPDTNADGFVDVDKNNDGTTNAWDLAACNFNYSLVKNTAANAESYYLIKDENDNTVEGYTIDAYFNIEGEGVDTNLFCADSPYRPYPTDFLYMTKSSDGGKTWSVPKLINVKLEEEQCLLVGPGRGLVTSEGRIIFTVYDYTYTDKFSAVIYSDDGGETWKRGQDVPEKSSEATVTEVDGKLYMFTRYGGYYISENWGESWSDRQWPDINYETSCQLNAITYSQKIDGKTAILLSVPGASYRINGRIFVGLVQDDGTINWAYEYQVNTGHYAYSCLTEPTDGSIGLLYENGGASIKYVNIPIEDIADGAVIGDIWFTDADSVVDSVVLKPNESAELTVNGISEGETLNAVANNDAVNVTVAGNIVTVTSAEHVTGFEEVEVTVSAGNEKIVLTVYVTDSEKNKIVELASGETAAYVDETGNYKNTADLSSVDASVATVTVSDASNNDVEDSSEAMVQLGIDASYSEDKILASECLYTYTSAWTVSATDADETEVYLNLESSGKMPNKTAAANINIFAGSTAGTFKLQDTNASRHLHFWYDDANKLYYDRCGNSCGVSDEFEIYKASESSTESPIPGYVKVTNLNEIASGGQYLIARAATDGSYYIMHPVNSQDENDHVAKIVVDETSGEVSAQLGSDNSYSGDKIDVSACLYTFTKTTTFSATDAGENTVYLNPGATAGYPNVAESTNITVSQGSVENSFSLFGGDRYLHFYRNNNAKKYFDRVDTIQGYEDATSFLLYKKAADGENSSTEVPGYVLAETVESGKQYLILAKDNDTYYALYPHVAASGESKYTQVAKIVKPEPAKKTTIVIEAVGEGKTSIEVGGTTYHIIVKNKVKNIALKLGDSTILSGDLIPNETQQIVAAEKITDSAPYGAVDTIVSGEKYLIGNTSHLITNQAISVSGDPEGLAMTSANYNRGSYQEYLWTVTAVEDGYYIQDADENYMSLAGNGKLSVESTAQTLTIYPSKHGGFAIKNAANNQHVNNYKGDNDNVAGYTSDDNAWYFYQPVGYKITGKTVGSTTLTIGGVNYNITVYADPADYTNVDNALEKVPADLSKYTADSVKVLEEAIAKVDRSKDSTEQEAVEAMAKAIEEAIAALVQKPSDDEQPNDKPNDKPDSTNPDGGNNNNSSNNDSKKTSGTNAGKNTTTSTPAGSSTTPTATGDSAMTFTYVALMFAAVAVIFGLKKKETK